MDSYSNLRARAKCNRFAEHNGIELTLIETDHVEGRSPSPRPISTPWGWSTAAVSPLWPTRSPVRRWPPGPGGRDHGLPDGLPPAGGQHEKIRCVAIPQKIGKTITLYRAELTNDEGALVAVGTFSFFLTDKPLPNFEELVERAKAYGQTQKSDKTSGTISTEMVPLFLGSGIVCGKGTALQGEKAEQGRQEGEERGSALQPGGSAAPPQGRSADFFQARQERRVRPHLQRGTPQGGEGVGFPGVRPSSWASRDSCSQSAA